MNDDDTRPIVQCYLDIGDCTIGRTETRGRDGTSSREEWWIQRHGDRSKSSIREIEQLIRTSALEHAECLALFFAQARQHGEVVINDYMQQIDFRASLARDPKTVFPRLHNRCLSFVVRRTTPDVTPTAIEYWDVTVNLDTMDDRAERFWSGAPQDLTLLSQPNRAHEHRSRMSSIPADIRQRVVDDFGAERATEVYDHLLAKIPCDLANGAHSQHLRCILFLAEGDADRLDHYINECLLEPRNIMLAAEYEYDAKVRDSVRKRDLSKAFAEAEYD